MRSIILDYTSQLDVMTGNPTVKSYFTNIGYEVDFVSKHGIYPNVSIYSNLAPVHSWLAKILWNIPTTEPKTNRYHGDRWKHARWISAEE